MRVVLDSSAVLAFLFQEPGAEAVAAAAGGAALSAVNASEILAVLLREGGTRDQAREALETLDLTILAVDLALAISAADLYPVTHRAGLSLGDRFCLALAKSLGRPVLTADRAWARISDEAGIEVRVIR